MRTFMYLGSVVIAAAFALAVTLDAADARRGGGGGMRGGGFSGGGGMRGGGFSGAGMRGGGGRIATARPGGPHVSHPIARPGIGNRPGGPGWGGGNVPGWGNRPGYGPGYPGSGWGAAAALGAGLAYSGYGSGYGSYDDGAYVAPSEYAVSPESDASAECARRFKTYDPVSQTYVRRKGERAPCP